MQKSDIDTYNEKNNGRGGGKYRKGFKKKNDKEFKALKKQTQGQSIDAEIEAITSKYAEVQPSDVSKFSDFPLSKKTQKGLSIAKYTAPTEIQRQSVSLALQGKDVLGAAKTGSGKTLAFVIPLLECLYRKKWSSWDGLGALVISPTRELAYQTFSVLRKVGKLHDFSAGLVIGGKHVREEADRINRTNIIICTPGRLLQHMDETPYFHADNLQMLVLDEADRILDLGFQETMNAIIQNLPTDRQTLLFSATQTKSVKDLARLSLKSPVYVSVHENAQYSTPQKLEQSYIVCELHEKLDMLWSFLRSHLKAKILVFLTSCKQVRYAYAALCKLRPGMTVLGLHGAMQQIKRMEAYQQFCNKQHAVLIATDVAARGLDFPAVNWVIQLDCPEDANTYIHRAGRTARYEKDGEALLVLLPSEEEAMVERLQQRRIPVQKIEVNSRKVNSIQGKLDSLCASEVQLKEFAQRAFTSYLKSVFLMKDKDVFDVQKLDFDAYARSLGLAVAPRIRFLQKEQKRLEAAKLLKEQNTEVAGKMLSSKSEKAPVVVAADHDFGQESGSVLEDDDEKNEAEQAASSHSSASSDSEDDDDNDDNMPQNMQKFDFGIHDEDLDDILKVKETETASESEEETLPEPKPQSKKSVKKQQMTKYALAKKLQKKNIKVNTKVQFDEEGEAIEDLHKKAKTSGTEDKYDGGINIAEAKMRLEEEDQFDKRLYAQKIKQKHREQRLKEKERRKKKKVPTATLR